MLEKTISAYPSGKIHIVNKYKYTQFYLRTNSNEKSGKYLNRSQTTSIKTYLQKYYDERALRIIEKELRVLEKFNESYSSLSGELQGLYSTLPSRAKAYIEPLDISNDEYAARWENCSYERKPINGMAIDFITDRGEKVRSKSELLIANTLNKMGIPYKYECPLTLQNGLVIHPDFTVLNKYTRKVYYWEHRGMMDDREYARHSVSRIKDLEKAGIHLGKALIITEETSTLPLGSSEIINIIKEYFLE